MPNLHYTLERHIFHLLFQEDSVDVPGFGRLEAQRFGAEIQLQSGLFLPPARRLSFSPVAGKSEVLINHLSRFEGLRADEARSAIVHEVNSWNRQLLEGKRLRLDGLGSFSKTGLQWVFQASIEANFLPEAYGLPIFRVTPLSQRQSPSQQIAAPLALPQVRQRREQWLAPLRTAAMVTGVITLLALGTTKSDFRDFAQNASFQLQWDHLTEQVTSWLDRGPAVVAVKDEFGAQVAPEIPFLQEELPSAIESSINPAIENVVPAPNEPSSPVAKPKPSVTSESYALVVGAFSDIQNARRLVAQLKEAGYPAKMVSGNVGLTKVALRTYANRDAANAAKEEAKTAFPAVWIYSE
ncbi:MAG: SPOR domain-containing protein [Schleiferiaceae bacterium]|nr:SPOR domain-containing protein [Schleiferiaceae bacterium]